MRISRYAVSYLAALIVITSLAALPAHAGWALETSSEDQLRLVGEVDLTGLSLQRDQMNGYDLLGIEGAALEDGSLQAGGYLAEPGKPLLPTWQVRVAIPAGYDARGLEVLRTETRSETGSYDPMPAQPPVPCAQVGPVEWVPQDQNVYASDAVYPASPARLLGQTDYAGQAMAVVELVPVDYRGATQSLRRHETVEIAIALAEGGARGDLLPEAATIADQARAEARLRAQVVNPDQVRTARIDDAFHGARLLPYAGGASGAGGTGGAGATGGVGGAGFERNLDPGDYDYVIISPIGFESVYEELADWKNRRGVRTTIISIDWIYNAGGYTGTDEEKIRAFVIDAHSTWGTESFLLGGDTNKIPCHWRWLEDNIPNDTYYADYDDDWTAEVNVGRVPARYSSYAYNFIQKVLTYEKTPPMTDFASLALFMGFDLDASTAGEEVKNAIDDLYMPGDWTILTEHDSESGTHKEDAVALINAGFNLYNHIDHSNTSWMGLGVNNHDQSLGIGDVNAFVNGDRVGTVYSTGCYACNYEDYQCIAEAWVQNNNGGAIAFVGNSRYGWYNPGLLNTLSNRYDRLFFRSIFEQGHIDLGDAFSDHKNDQYPGGDPTYRYVWTELTLLGDPELRLWMADPSLIAVTHPSTFTGGPGEVTVNVTYEGGGSVAGATVCLWKPDEEIHLVETTGSGGAATFSVDPQNAGEIYVTVSGADVVPYEGTILVLDASSVDGAEGRPALSLRAARTVAGGAASGAGGTELVFVLPQSAEVSLAVYDLSGRQVRALLRGERFDAGRHPVRFDGRDDAGRPLGSGVYLYRLQVGGEHREARSILLR